MSYWHYYTFRTNVVSWFRHLLCLVLMLLGFFVIPFQIFSKQEGLTSTTTHSPRSYKKVVSWFRTPFYALVLMLLGFGLSQSKRCLTGTTTHSIRMWFHGFRHLLCFDTNVTRIQTFPKQRCLTGTTTHSIRKWFHGSDTLYAWY